MHGLDDIAARSPSSPQRRLGLFADTIHLPVSISAASPMRSSRPLPSRCGGGSWFDCRQRAGSPAMGLPPTGRWSGVHAPRRFGARGCPPPRSRPLPEWIRRKSFPLRAMR
jgi:hypothetical protein